jgi:hypothetical protein
MSAPATAVPAAPLAGESAPAANPAGKFLAVGVAGLAVAAAGVFVSGPQHAATSYLVGISYWTAIAIGMLMLVMIHHIFDAGWSTVIRRQYEHGLAAFKWLFLLFLPLAATPFIGHGDIVWPWMNLAHELHGHGTVGADVLYQKKAAFLNVPMFVGATLLFFAIWVGLSAILRRNSFNQDNDGEIKWTTSSRKWSAAGIPLGALTLTFASIYWMKSLEYHWFSTMYGVWFFANCVRAALAFGVFIMVWLWARGDYRGILNKNHWHCIGTLGHAFVIFWAYVTFSQYFLIWNANVPEETFWYNLREITHDGHDSQWKYVGLLILFGHFFVPFLWLLRYKNKSEAGSLWPIRGLFPVSVWISVIILVDLCYNILPALKDDHGDPLPFLSLNLVWVAASVVGVGGVCVWAYLRSLAASGAKLIPVRDPRIQESLTYHE